MGVTTYTRNIVTVGVNSGVDSTASFCVVALVVALGLLEMQRRVMFGGASRRPWGVSLKSCTCLLRQSVPEVVGIIVCVGTVAVLLSRPQKFGSPEDEEMWAELKLEWPRLACADTLLAIQAMLRVVVLAAATFHARTSGRVSLASQSATLLGLGCLARVTAGAGSEAYLLDGPLGAKLPVVCDVASMMLALSLGKACFWKRPLPTVFTVIALTWLSSRHCLNLSGGKPHLDALFVASYGFDLLAALTHLFQNLSIGSAGAALPRQAILAAHGVIGAYYFHYALPHTEELVLVGCPLQFLELAHTAAAAACLGAMALFAVGDAPEVLQRRATPLPSSRERGACVTVPTSTML